MEVIPNKVYLNIYPLIIFVQKFFIITYRYYNKIPTHKSCVYKLSAGGVFVQRCKTLFIIR